MVHAVQSTGVDGKVVVEFAKRQKKVLLARFLTAQTSGES